jgi:hypothetical protein
VYRGWRLGSCKKTGKLCSSGIGTRPSCLHWFQGDDSGSERDSESVILRDVFFFLACNVMHFVENCFFAGEDDRGEWTHVCADVCLSESCAAFWGW